MFAIFGSDCPLLTAPHQISMLQDETIKVMLEKCGGSRMAHILLTIPIIRLAGDGKVLQVLYNIMLIKSNRIFE